MLFKKKKKEIINSPEIERIEKTAAKERKERAIIRRELRLIQAQVDMMKRN